MSIRTQTQTWNRINSSPGIQCLHRALPMRSQQVPTILLRLHLCTALAPLLVACIDEASCVCVYCHEKKTAYSFWQHCTSCGIHSLWPQSRRAKGSHASGTLYIYIARWVTGFRHREACYGHMFMRYLKRSRSPSAFFPVWTAQRADV